MTTMRVPRVTAFALSTVLLGLARGARAGKPDPGRDGHRHAVPGRGGAALQEAGLLALRRPQLTRRGFCGATRTCTPRTRSTPPPSATRLGPEAAYRFARGEEVVSSSGQPVKLSRPLDFLVVADHAEGLGSTVELKSGQPEPDGGPDAAAVARDDGGGRRGRRRRRSRSSARSARAPAEGDVQPPARRTRSGRHYTATAERYNEPGRFTAFIGYEWTSNTGGNNLHRVVIFRDGKDKADQIVPFSRRSAATTRAILWKWMDAYAGQDRRRGARHPAQRQSLQRAHVRRSSIFDGRGLTRDYAETRARLEPVYEVTQIKGDGETHPFLSPNDEFAGFERWDKGNLDLTELKKPEMLQYEYARSGLEARAQAGAGTRRQPVQVRHDRLDRLAHRRWPPPTRTTSSASTAAPSRARPARPHAFLASPDGSVTIMRLGDGRLRLCRRCGRPRTRARRSSTR